MNTPTTTTKPKATPITGQAPKPTPAAPQTAPTPTATASEDPACKTPKPVRPLEEILAEQIAAQEAELKAKKRKLQTIRQRKAALAKSAERKERAERVYILGFTFGQMLAMRSKDTESAKGIVHNMICAYNAHMKTRHDSLTDKQREKAEADRRLLTETLNCILTHGDITPPKASKNTSHGS